MIKRNLSYIHGTSETPLLGMTVDQKFQETVKKYPTNEALIVKHQAIRWSYSELDVEIDSCAKALMAMQIEKGDRVGIWSPNRYEWTVLQFATARIGAILVNINPSYRIHELEYALKQSGCKMLVLAD